MSMNRILLFLVAGLFLFGCAQPAAPAASATPLASAAVASATPVPSPAAFASPTAVAALPSVAASPSVPPVAVPASLDALAAQVAALADGYFNSSAKALQEQTGRFVIHEKTKEYEFSVVVTGASRRWIKDDTLRNFTSASGVTNGALVFEGNTLKQFGFLLAGSQLTPRYYGYFATMKCFGQKYEVQLHLVDYRELTPDIYRKDVGPNAMKVLVAACPA